MNDVTRLTLKPLRICSAPKSAFHGALGATFATAVAVVLLLFAATMFRIAATGLEAVTLCGWLGAAIALVPGIPGPRLAHVLGGFIGGLFAGWFAVSFGEILSPGTWEWAYVTGAWATLFAIPMAAVVGGGVGLMCAPRLPYIKVPDRSQASKAPVGVKAVDAE